VEPPKRGSRLPKCPRVRLRPSRLNRVRPLRGSLRSSPRSASINPARRNTMKVRLRATDGKGRRAPSTGAPATPKVMAAGIASGKDMDAKERALRIRAPRKPRAGRPVLSDKRINRTPRAFRRAHRRQAPPRAKLRPRRARHRCPLRRRLRHRRVRLHRVRPRRLHLRPRLVLRPPASRLLRRETQKHPRPRVSHGRTPGVARVTPPRASRAVRTRMSRALVGVSWLQRQRRRQRGL
jgi:hypothetical protein